jgi:hypothetical protein
MKRIFPILMALAIAGSAYANGLGGQRLEKVVGDQIVDVGTDRESAPVAGETIEFDFNLLNSDTREPVTNATSVGLNIGHNGKMMVNCDLIPEAPTTFLFYTFPEGGDYTLTVTFFDKNRDRQELATATFPLTIAGSSSRMRTLYVAAFFVCVILSFLGLSWKARKRKLDRVAG